METKTFKKILLKTAFSCMACDGDIDKREVALIKKMHKEKGLFGEININEELEKLLKAINKDGHQFLKDYLSELSATTLSKVEELQLIVVAIDTIKADDIIEYSEVKFFKVIRSKLKIESEEILKKHPDFEEYLEQDIVSESYLSGLYDNYFNTESLPIFDMKSIIEDK